MRNDLNEWLTVREAADQLKVNERTVRRMIQYGELKTIGKDRTRLIHRASIKAATPRKVGVTRKQRPDARYRTS